MSNPFNSSDYFKILDDLNSSQQNPVSLSGYGITGDDVAKIQQLNKNISDYSANNNIGHILSAQTDMSGIMQKEQKYLQNRKQDIAQDVQTGERTMRLNDSTRKKYYSYVTIVLVWVGVLIIALVLVFLNRSFGIPFNLLFALVMAVALFWTGWTLYQMSLRDPVDFDKLNLLPPDQVGADYVNKDSNNNLWNGFGLDCIGANCCPPGNTFGLVYDKTMNQCVLATTANSFTTTPPTGAEGVSPTPPRPTGLVGDAGVSPTPPRPTGLGGAAGVSPTPPMGATGGGTNQPTGNNNQNMNQLFSSIFPNWQSSIGGNSNGFQNMSNAENFMTIADLLSAYPPQFPMRLVKPVQYNYACESEQLYCNPKI
jgi:hypothetical protein